MKLYALENVDPAMVRHCMAMWVSEPSEQKRILSEVLGDKARALRAKTNAVIAYDRVIDRIMRGDK